MAEQLTPEERGAKLALIATFLGAVGMAGLWRGERRAAASVMDIALTGLASHRIGRMIAFERVAVPLREPFTETVPDDSGVDDTVVARGTGIQGVVGELLSCPTCVGTWAALGLHLGLGILPGPTRMLTTVLATAQVAELTGGVVEGLEWAARAARKRAG
jgi:hypothetical protein